MRSTQVRSLEMSSCIRLIDLFNGEVGGVDIRRKSRLERSSDGTEVVEGYTPEEGMVLDLFGSTSTETVFGIADQAGRGVSKVFQRSELKVVAFE